MVDIVCFPDETSNNKKELASLPRS